MVKKIATCVLISGTGSNLKSLIKSSREYSFPLKIKLILSNNNKAYGLRYAKKYNIPYKFFNSKPSSLEIEIFWLDRPTL